MRSISIEALLTSVNAQRELAATLSTVWPNVVKTTQELRGPPTGEAKISRTTQSRAFRTIWDWRSSGILQQIPI